MKISSLASAAAVAVRGSWLPSRKTLSVKVVISMISEQGGPAVLLVCGVSPFRANKLLIGRGFSMEFQQVSQV